jgi:hypothetical protein
MILVYVEKRLYEANAGQMYNDGMGIRTISRLNYA